MPTSFPTSVDDYTGDVGGATSPHNNPPHHTHHQDIADAVVAVQKHILDNLMPVGSIIFYDGDLAALPTNWRYCDGLNGTPDLRDRFVVGTSATYALNARGGLATVALTTAEMPIHNHTASSGTVSNWHTHSGTTASQNTNHYHTQGNTGAGGGHYHNFRYGVVSSATGRYLIVNSGERATHPDPTDVITAVGDHVHATPDTNPQSHSHQHTFTTGNPSSNHTHSVTVDNAGSDQAHENRPPYHALHYIKRVA